MATERPHWTDDRLDERLESIDARLGRIEGRFDHMQASVDGRLARLQSSFDSLRNLLIQITFGLIGMLIAALVALVIAVA